VDSVLSFPYQHSKTKTRSLQTPRKMPRSTSYAEILQSENLSTILKQRLCSEELERGCIEEGA